MVPCVAIDSSNRPNEIPIGRWIVKNESYKVVYVSRLLPQNILGVQLYEKPLGEDCYPYEFFAASRFRFTEEGIKELMQMFKDIAESVSDEEMQQLLENSKLKTA